jgi:hypothetical protein
VPEEAVIRGLYKKRRGRSRLIDWQSSSVVVAASSTGLLNNHATVSSIIAFGKQFFAVTVRERRVEACRAPRNIVSKVRK